MRFYAVADVVMVLGAALFAILFVIDLATGERLLTASLNLLVVVACLTTMLIPPTMPYTLASLRRDWKPGDRL
jgi:hypothetical protein